MRERGDQRNGRKEQRSCVKTNMGSVQRSERKTEACEQLSLKHNVEPPSCISTTMYLQHYCHNCGLARSLGTNQRRSVDTGWMRTVHLFSVKYLHVYGPSIYCMLGVVISANIVALHKLQNQQESEMN